MSRIAILAVSAFAVIALSSAANAASFNCGGNLTYTEKTICDNPGLSRADDRMAYMYFNVVNNGNYRRGQAAQVRWLHERDSCGADVSCIWQEYHYRMQQLSSGSAY